MNYYVEIKEELIKNEVYKKVKDYSKNRSDLQTYYNVGKMLSEAGKHYGEGIIKQYSEKLTNELGKGYTPSRLRYFRRFYVIFSKCPTMSDKLSYSHYCEIMWLNQEEINYYIFISKVNLPTLSAKLSWSHYDEILKLKNRNQINYYIKISEEQNLSVRELREKIKSKEYERLDEKTKEKLKNNNKLEVQDLVKNPIILNTNKEIIKEKMLQQLILENISSFLKELGNGFSFVESEYKIKIGNNYNYIDLLLFNIEYNCYVVVELKITKLKKEHIGQIETYMNYIDKNIKKINQDKTIGIIITKEEDKYIMSYCSDERIFNTTYELQKL